MRHWLEGLRLRFMRRVYAVNAYLAQWEGDRAAVSMFLRLHDDCERDLLLHEVNKCG